MKKIIINISMFLIAQAVVYKLYNVRFTFMVYSRGCNMIYFLIFGFAVIGFMAYLGIKGTNEAIDFQNRRDR
jgi:hypothetical protein